MPHVCQPRMQEAQACHCMVQVTDELKLLMPAQPGGPLTLCCALQLAGEGLLPFDLSMQDILLLELSKILTQQSGVFAMELTQVDPCVTHHLHFAGCGGSVQPAACWLLGSAAAGCSCHAVALVKEHHEGLHMA